MLRDCVTPLLSAGPLLTHLPLYEVEVGGRSLPCCAPFSCLRQNQASFIGGRGAAVLMGGGVGDEGPAEQVPEGAKRGVERGEREEPSGELA